MSTGQGRVRQALTVALLVTSMFAAPAVAQTTDGTGDGSGNGTGTFDGTGSTNGGSGTDESCCGPDTGTGTGESARPRTLALEPGTGPPGAPVTVSGDGFGACLAQSDDVRPGTVELTWDGSSLATVDVARGRFTAGIQVPDPTPPGTAIVTGTCVGDPEITESAEFTVTGPDTTTDPAQTTGETAGTRGGTTPATGADAKDPSPTAGNVGEPGPTPQQAVDAAEAASRTGGGPPAAQVAVLLVVLAASAALLSHAFCHRRGPAWAAAHVSVVPGTTTQGTGTVASPPEGSPQTSVVRLEPRSGSVTHILQEVDR